MFVCHAICIAFFMRYYQYVLRPITSLLFLILYHNLSKDKKISINHYAFLLYIISDTFLIFYETDITASIGLFFKSVAAVLILTAVVPSFKEVIKDKKQMIFFLIILALDVYLFSLLIRSDMFMTIPFFHEVFLYIQLSVMLILLMVGASYCFESYTKASIVAMFFILSFVVSDFFAGFAFYLQHYKMFYLDRFFYCIGLGFFTYYLLLPKEEASSETL